VVNLDAPVGLWADPIGLQVGTPVVAVGNPSALPAPCRAELCTAVVDPVGFAPDVRLAPGNSEEPLADLRGEVVGINTMIVAGGLALAIPSRVVAVLPQPRGRVSLGWCPAGASSQRRYRHADLELSARRRSRIRLALPGDILLGDLQMAIDQAPGGLIHPFVFIAAGNTRCGACPSGFPGARLERGLSITPAGNEA